MDSIPRFARKYQRRSGSPADKGIYENKKETHGHVVDMGGEKWYTVLDLKKER